MPTYTGLVHHIDVVAKYKAIHEEVLYKLGYNPNIYIVRIESLSTLFLFQISFIYVFIIRILLYYLKC